MRKTWLRRSGTAELILVFGGWGIGAAPFTGMSSDADVLLVDDFRDLGDPVAERDAYDGISLVGFSFGVSALAHWCGGVSAAANRVVAINGTLYPVDADRGIAPETVSGTAENLSQKSFARFFRRAGLCQPVPEIDIESARIELEIVTERGPAPALVFDRIWVSERDRIFPSAAQLNAWRDQKEAVQLIPEGHIPFSATQSWEQWVS